MGFNDIELQRIKKIVGGFCEEKIPDNLRSQIKVFYEVRGYKKARSRKGRAHERVAVLLDIPRSRGLNAGR